MTTAKAGGQKTGKGWREVGKRCSGDGMGAGGGVIRFGKEVEKKGKGTEGWEQMCHFGHASKTINNL